MSNPKTVPWKVVSSLDSGALCGEKSGCCRGKRDPEVETTKKETM